MRILSVSFRWPVKQVDEKQVEVQIPTSKDGLPVINPRFAEAHRLTNGEVEEAEYRALRSIAVLPD